MTRVIKRPKTKVFMTCRVSLDWGVGNERKNTNINRASHDFLSREQYASAMWNMQLCNMHVEHISDTQSLQHLPYALHRHEPEYWWTLPICCTLVVQLFPYLSYFSPSDDQTTGIASANHTEDDYHINDQNGHSDYKNLQRFFWDWKFPSEFFWKIIQKAVPNRPY